jgi:hypothetical protein
MMEAISSLEMSVLTRATLHNILEDGIPHRHLHENLKSYNRYICYQIFRLKVESVEAGTASVCVAHLIVVESIASLSEFDCE